MIYVKIEDGVVVQKQPYAEDGFIEAPGEVICGQVFDGEVFSNPEPVVTVPAVVGMAQARKALIMGGVSIASVDSAIAAIVDQTERELAQTDWEYSTTVRRTSPLVASIGPSLNLTETQIDELFILAETL